MFFRCAEFPFDNFRRAPAIQPRVPRRFDGPTPDFGSLLDACPLRFVSTRFFNRLYKSFNVRGLLKYETIRFLRHVCIEIFRVNARLFQSLKICRADVIFNQGTQIYVQCQDAARWFPRIPQDFM